MCALWVGVFLLDGVSWLLVPHLLFVSALVLVSQVDIEKQIIPDVVILPVAAVGLPLMIALGESPWWQYPVAGAGAAGFLLLISEVYYRVRHQVGMGFGDVKLALCMGIYLGASVVPGAVHRVHRRRRHRRAHPRHAQGGRQDADPVRALPRRRRRGRAVLRRRPHRAPTSGWCSGAEAGLEPVAVVAGPASAHRRQPAAAERQRSRACVTLARPALLRYARSCARPHGRGGRQERGEVHGATVQGARASRSSSWSWSSRSPPSSAAWPCRASWRRGAPSAPATPRAAWPSCCATPRRGRRLRARRCRVEVEGSGRFRVVAGAARRADSPAATSARPSSPTTPAASSSSAPAACPRRPAGRARAPGTSRSAPEPPLARSSSSSAGACDACDARTRRVLADRGRRGRGVLALGCLAAAGVLQVSLRAEAAGRQRRDAARLLDAEAARLRALPFFRSASGPGGGPPSLLADVFPHARPELNEPPRRVRGRLRGGRLRQRGRGRRRAAAPHGDAACATRRRD